MRREARKRTRATLSQIVCSARPVRVLAHRTGQAGRLRSNQIISLSVLSELYKMGDVERHIVFRRFVRRRPRQL